MKISLNWLKDFVDIPKNINPQKLGELFTLHTAEVEEVLDLASQFEKMCIGKVLELKKHPDADKLKIAITDIGNRKVQVVCGGKNLAEGMLIPYAGVGAKVKWHGQGDLIELAEVKIRGVESEGMICAGEEIGLAPADYECITDLSHLNAKPGTPLAEALGMDDVILEIDNKSLTHRPDLWSHYGIAREAATIFKKKLKTLQIKEHKSTKTEKLSVEVENPKSCPRYCGVVIDNIKIAESPEWMKQRLEAIGYRSINNIVDITNYVMAELGHPLHAFDYNYIKDGIIVRNAKDKEKFVTLDGETRILEKNMLVITDKQKAVAIAGVMGGENSEIGSNTTKIIIESANFDSINVRKTSTALGLRTESVQRFEKGLDPNLSETAIRRAIELVLEICSGAEVVSEITDVKNFENKNLEIPLNLNKVNSKIGIEVSENRAKEILNSLGFETVRGGDLSFSVPEWRAQGDIKNQDDLIEEIARIEGYENINPVLPPLPINLPIENTERTLKHEARNFLSLGLGLTEVYNYSFYSRKEVLNCNLGEEKHIKVKNYLSEDQTHMRVSLVPNFLKSIFFNLKNFEEFKIYEIGRTYEETGEFMPKEEKIICAAYIKEKPAKSDQKQFFAAKEGLYALLNKLRFSNAKLKKSEKPLNHAHPEQCMEVLINKNTVGYVYSLHPLIAKNFDLKGDIALFELNLSLLVKAGRDDFKYESLPKFPGINFDVSVLVGEEKTVEKLRNAIFQSEQKLVKQVELFDIYRGENIEKGKKALAFNILLQDPERTLNDADFKIARDKIFAGLKNVGAEVRGEG